ncbi:MAG: hypothetical protein KC964_28730 [Candidatus Omnitrophica bacterium]|nr:hypothetical protein [Candidatus Omnitrophota bacterium]
MAIPLRETLDPLTKQFRQNVASLTLLSVIDQRLTQTSRQSESTVPLPQQHNSRVPGQPLLAAL